MDCVGEDDALVSTSPTGAPIRLQNFRRRVWKPALDEAQLPTGFRIHDRRHTAASLLINAGVTYKAVQEHLGPSSSTVTLDRYWHLDPANGYRHPSVSSFDQPLVVVCNGGYSSALAAASLLDLGFVDVADLVGGMRAWTGAGHPVVAADHSHLDI